MKFELFVGLRYLKAKRTNKFVSTITIISIIGVAVGVMTLIAVLSVMNGFQITIREKIINTGFHIYATRWGDESLIKNYKELIKKLQEEKDIVYSTPFLEGQAIVKLTPQRFLGIKLFGIEPTLYQKDKSFGNTVRIEKGNFDLNSQDNILLGNELCKNFGISIGDKIEIIAPTGGAGDYKGMIVPSIKKFNVAGIFKIGYYEYDLERAFISLSSAQKLFGKQDYVSGIGIRIKDIFSAAHISYKIKHLLNYKYQIFTWMDFNRNLFTALKNEKAMMTFIVFLIIMVASFNIASTLIMVIIEKKKEIGILKTMGATSNQISKIFLIEGGTTGIIGTILGFISGLLISRNLESIFAGIESLVNFIRDTFFKVFGNLLNLDIPAPFRILSKDVYYFEKLPVIIDYKDILMICLGSILISVIFSIIPARQAAKLNPVDAIRYE